MAKKRKPNPHQKSFDLEVKQVNTKNKDSYRKTVTPNNNASSKSAVVISVSKMAQKKRQAELSSVYTSIINRAKHLID